MRVVAPPSSLSSRPNVHSVPGELRIPIMRLGTGKLASKPPAGPRDN